MKCKSSAFQQLHLLSLCSRRQTGEAPDAHESLHEKCPPVWDKWFHTNAEWQSVGRKWHTVGEKRERPAGDTWGERQNKSTRVRQREKKRKCGGDSLSVIHSHSGMREYDSFFYPSDGWKRLVIQSKGTDSSTFTFLFQILWTVFESVCAYVCACVRESVKVCVFALPHGLHAGRGELLYSSLRQSTAAGGHRRRLSLRCHHPHRRAMCGLPEVSCTHKHICSYINSRTACPLWLVGWFICLDSYSACLNPKPKMHNSSCFCVADIIP